LALAVFGAIECPPLKRHDVFYLRSIREMRGRQPALPRCVAFAYAVFVRRSRCSVQVAMAPARKVLRKDCLKVVAVWLSAILVVFIALLRMKNDYLDIT